MKLHNQPKTVSRRKKRLGRGYGSGKGGHTAGRGQKGQKSRGKVRLLFEGTKVRKSFIRRMPMLRGKGKLTSLAKRPVILNLTDLASFASGSNVTSQALVRNGLVTEKEARSQGVKILGRGTVTKKLTVSLPVSIAARKKIEKAGGKVIEEKILASQKEQTPRSKS